MASTGAFSRFGSAGLEGLPTLTKENLRLEKS
jgi:hypothetical protein